MKHKTKIRDKYWDERHPNNNLDFVEVHLPDEAVDDFIRKYGTTNTAYDDTQQSRKKKERLIRKILKAASIGFTERQFQIFVFRYVCALKEVEIARQLKVNQSYIANVLKACHYKLQKLLRLIPKKPRISRRKNQINPELPTVQK